MHLLLVRHAIAEDREAYTGDDRARPLTTDGRRKMRQAARALAELVPDLELVATSPLTRAAQTAGILAEAYKDAVKTVAAEALEPHQPPKVLARWLASRGEDTVAVVGHEPALGLAASWLLARSDRSFVALKKGGACLLELPLGARSGTAVLHWSLTPGNLRSLTR